MTAIPDGERATARCRSRRFVDSAIAFIEHTTAREEARSTIGRRSALARSRRGSCARWGSFSCSLLEALRFIRERVHTLQGGHPSGRVRAISMCRALSQACFPGRPYLFVVGLEEGRVFPTASEDAVLLDDERAAISQALRRSTDKKSTNRCIRVLTRLATWERCGSCNGHVQLFLSRHARVPRNLRVVAHAASVSTAARQSGGLVSADEGRAGRAEVHPFLLTERRGIVFRRLVASQRCRHWRQGWLVVLSATFPAIARGRLAEKEEGQSNALTEYRRFRPRGR